MNIIASSLLRSDRMRTVVLPGIATGMLVVLVGARLAELTWMLVPGAPFQDPARPIALDAPSTPMMRVLEPALAEAHLFGAPAAGASIAAPGVDVPETTLHLELSGIVSVTSKEGEDGAAIIASGRAAARSYHVGQMIEGTDATVRWVYGDRVVLDRSGALEYLSLPNSGSALPAR